jgi:hypothetical protein
MKKLIFTSRPSAIHMNRILSVLFILLVLGALSCTASRNGNCGCPSRKGMVGY